MKTWVTSLFILLVSNNCFCQIESSSQRDFIFKNGLFIDGVIGVARIHQKYDYANFITYYENGEAITIKPQFETQIKTGINFKLGYNWYFGSKQIWKPGIKLTFLNLGIITDFKQMYGMNPMVGGGLGFSNIFKLNETSGIECNLKGGAFMLLTDRTKGWSTGYSPTGAISYGFEVKYRYKTLSIGLDFSRLEADINRDRYTSINNYAISVGAKF